MRRHVPLHLVRFALRAGIFKQARIPVVDVHISASSVPKYLRRRHRDARSAAQKKTANIQKNRHPQTHARLTPDQPVPCSHKTGKPMRLLISFAALFLSVVLLQLGSGGLGPLDALSGLQMDFSRAQVGLLGSAHFLGFFIGCWWAPRLMGAVGHSRTFAAFIAAGTIGILAHMIVIDAYAWAAFRIMSGFASLAVTRSSKAGCRPRSPTKPAAARWRCTGWWISAARLARSC